MLDVVGDELVVVANTGDDVEVYGAHVSPDPDLVTFWLADRIDERGWGLRGRHVPRDGRAARARRRRLVQPRRPRPRDRACAARRAPAPRARRSTEAHRRAAARRSACGARVLPMCDEPVRTRVLRARRAGVGFQEFMIRERGAGPGRGRRARGHRGGARRRAEVLDAIARRARDRDRPVEPGHLDRPDPRGARACARRCAPRPRRSSRSRPLVGGAGAQGPDRRRSWRGPGYPLERRRASPRAYDGLLDGHGRRRARVDGARRALADRHAAWTTPTRAGASADETLASPLRSR